jgi:CBS domain-containing protein
MRVSEILATKGHSVETTGPDATVGRAAQRLRSAHIGSLVVSRDGQHVDGLIAERDIVNGLARYGSAVLDMRVKELMHRSPPTCAASDSIHDVMARMTTLRVRHLPVLDHGALCGIVSIGDVVKNRLEEAEREVSYLRDAYLARG